MTPVVARIPQANFFFNDTATTEIYTLSLHDALPISGPRRPGAPGTGGGAARRAGPPASRPAARGGAARGPRRDGRGRTGARPAGGRQPGCPPGPAGAAEIGRAHV